jgi:hypothetical protein
LPLGSHEQDRGTENYDVPNIGDMTSIKNFTIEMEFWRNRMKTSKPDFVVVEIQRSTTWQD